MNVRYYYRNVPIVCGVAVTIVVGSELDVPGYWISVIVVLFLNFLLKPI